MSNTVFSQKIYAFLLSAYRWYLQTPERSLDAAYQTALKIKDIEDKHFNGNKIDSNSAMHSASVMEYFESDLKKLLKTARMRLTEFKFSRWFSNESHQKAADKVGIEYPSLSSVLEKLQFIDYIISKYNNFDEVEPPASGLVAQPHDKVFKPEIVESLAPPLPAKKIEKRQSRKAETTGVIPRSIITTLTRLQVQLDPKAEEDVVKSFRQAKKRTILSIRFILLLIIVPLLTHQLSKVLVVGPLVDRFQGRQTEEIFLNQEMEEEALTELQKLEEKIKFENLIQNAPPLSVKEIERKLEEKAEELAKEFKAESSNAIKNVFADIFSVVAFICLLQFSKPTIRVLKDFVDNIVYGLSDSAKAFILILSTDMFVGFHSPHGWEVVLEGVSRHWGLPASRDFIFLFIATFPVILDTVFKYWIFRYLNRISPSAVATYRNMNE